MFPVCARDKPKRLYKAYITENWVNDLIRIDKLKKYQMTYNNIHILLYVLETDPKEAVKSIYNYYLIRNWPSWMWVVTKK